MPSQSNHSAAVDGAQCRFGEAGHWDCGRFQRLLSDTPIYQGLSLDDSLCDSWVVAVSKLRFCDHTCRLGRTPSPEKFSLAAISATGRKPQALTKRLLTSLRNMHAFGYPRHRHP